MQMIIDKNDDTRFVWSIETVSYEGATPHPSLAYTLKSEDYKIIRWASNDAVIPSDIMEKLEWPHKGIMGDARAKQTQDALNQYFVNQAQRTPEQIAEEQFEMRAAFGAGAEVVNIITGKRTQL
jgi:hypothetical protein